MQRASGRVITADEAAPGQTELHRGIVRGSSA